MRTKLLLSLLVSLAIVVAGCGTGTEEPAGQPADPAPADDDTQEPDDPADEPAEPEEPVEPVRVALLGPMSGPWAEHGEQMRMGAELAIDDINEAGGIQSLGGARLELIVEDAGDSVETVTSAAQRLFRHDDISAAMCCWLSSFTLAATEISEREGLPVLTFSFAEAITTRGYEYIFREGAPAPWHVETAIPLLEDLYEGVGRELRTAALVGDNTAASESYFAALRDQLPGAGIEIIIDEVWTPPLPDATSLARRVQQASPDIVFNGATTFADVETLQRAMNGAGVNVPQLGNGAQFVSKALLESLGQEGLTYVLSLVGNGVLSGMEDLAGRFEDRFGRFMVQDSSAVYAEMMILKEALEIAGSRDRDAIRDALRGISLSDGPPASYIPGGAVEYDESGQNVHAVVAVQAWVDGRPVTVAPAEQAVAALELPD
jgi:branched-chain amino acid transport system substrate-binding protein